MSCVFLFDLLTARRTMATGVGRARANLMLPVRAGLRLGGCAEPAGRLTAWANNNNKTQCRRPTGKSTMLSRVNVSQTRAETRARANKLTPGAPAALSHLGAHNERADLRERDTHTRRHPNIAAPPPLLLSRPEPTRIAFVTYTPLALARQSLASSLEAAGGRLLRTQPPESINQLVWRVRDGGPFLFVFTWPKCGHHNRRISLARARPPAQGRHRMGGCANCRSHGTTTGGRQKRARRHIRPPHTSQPAGHRLPTVLPRRQPAPDAN